MKKYLITIAAFFCSLPMYAQQGFVSVGGDTNNSYGSVSFSVGQLDYNFFGNASNLITEGLQQPFEISGALPIILLYFKANATKENTVLLKWSTTSENNNNYFTIERSKDANNFQKVSTIPSGGNSTVKQDYALTDFQPYQGISYYRLTQTDKDGKYIYTQIASCKVPDQPGITLYPNPANNYITISGIENYTALKIYNMAGQQLRNYLLKDNLITIPINKLSNGLYIVELSNNNKITKASFLKK